MESTDINCLVEMGFAKDKAVEALSVTKGQGIQAAVDWLFANAGDSLGQNSSNADQTAVKSEAGTSDNTAEVADPDNKMATTETGKEVACLVCDDCGKKFRNESDAQFHAVKSKHQNFSESTEVIAPLTAEQKQEQAARLQEKLIARRKQREEEEKKLNLEREKSRRKVGKEVTEIKQKHQYEEMKKLADQRKKEKLEEKAIRQRLKQQIAEDRANLKAAQQKQSNLEQSTPAVTATPAAPTTLSQSTKEYKECRVQFRLTNGTCLTAKFKPDDVFSTLSDYVTANRTDGDGPFKLMTTFPRKEFTTEHMNMSLCDLGLVPSSVIMVTKA